MQLGSLLLNKFLWYFNNSFFCYTSGDERLNEGEVTSDTEVSIFVIYVSM